MLKISFENDGDQGVTLRLEGRIAGLWTTELNELCEKLLREKRPLSLLMADVAFLDRRAAQVLAKLESRGVILAECSPFTTAQLKSCSA
jgi:hypothetical protein